MARSKKSEPADGEGGAAPGRSKLVPAIVLALGVAAAGWFLKPGAEPAPPAAAAAEAVPAVEEPVEGPVAMLEPITLNLADGHYLKVGLALQTAASEEGGGDHGGGEAVAMPPGETAKASDLAIAVFSRERMSDLANPDHRAEVKAQLIEQVTAAYHGDVTDVYFTQFVMQ